MDVMSEAIEQRAGQTLGPEHAGPFVERQVRCDDGLTALVALAEYFEQQLCPGLAERDISKLVDDQERVSGHLPLQTKQPLLIASVQQFMNKGRAV
jgi:hypothetical protein